MIARAPNGATAVSYVSGKDADAYAKRAERMRDRANELSIDRIIEMKAVGITPEYLATIRAASPRMRTVDLDEVVGLRAVGVTPEYVRSLSAAGLPNLDASDLTQARAVGLSADYVRGMRAAGFRGSIDDYVQLQAVGVTPAYVYKFKKVGYTVTSARELVKFKAHGVTAESVRVAPPRPPEVPRAPAPDEHPDDG